MIWLDVTKTASARQKSGLTRVTTRLREELGREATPSGWRGAKGWEGMTAGREWYLTAEVFSPAERAGFDQFMRDRPLKLAAVFHDAIPLELPLVTWPKAVARHPAYLSMLADFDRVFAVSEASRRKLEGFWRWQGRPVRARLDLLTLGADFLPGAGDRPSGSDAAPGVRHGRAGPPGHDFGGRKAGSNPILLCVGIIEPRKRQDLLLSAAEALWREGLAFELWFVGRVNPHFGRPILKRIRRSRAVYQGAVDDAELARCYGQADACVMPTIAEGCGLPLLESLWCGTPCLVSDLPALRENAGGGCQLVPPDDIAAWTAALRGLLSPDGVRARLKAETAARRAMLPRWADTARMLQSFFSA